MGVSTELSYILLLHANLPYCHKNSNCNVQYRLSRYLTLRTKRPDHCRGLTGARAGRLYETHQSPLPTIVTFLVLEPINSPLRNDVPDTLILELSLQLILLATEAINKCGEHNRPVSREAYDCIKFIASSIFCTNAWLAIECMIDSLPLCYTSPYS
ncbi:hypothetical protein CC78DRAFT_577059 [Lojkania enalia]|uniref:Uncharacterized protein n=1 Tax=Lojkania enalia TaxID=147567 RepID=A0A9P4KJ13_9PLEO|nr:hypothetical protein CC78DRAFT_577059 [Didymosphaeria enalia]